MGKGQLGMRKLTFLKGQIYFEKALNCVAYKVSHSVITDIIKLATCLDSESERDQVLFSPIHSISPGLGAGLKALRGTETMKTLSLLWGASAEWDLGA